MKNETQKTPYDIMQEKIAQRISNPLWSRDMASRVLKKRKATRLRWSIASIVSTAIAAAIAFTLVLNMDISQDRRRYSLFVNNQIFGVYGRVLSYSPNSSSLEEVVTSSAATANVDALISETLGER